MLFHIIYYDILFIQNKCKYLILLNLNYQYLKYLRYEILYII